MLTVVTHTRFTRPDLLERCTASVAAALPDGAQHLIIPCHTNFAKARFEATRLSRYVAFVDDDDYINPTALKLCLTAIKETGAGVAFTDEVSVDLDGTRQFVRNGGRSYQDVSKHPRTIHHLTVIDCNYVSPKALELNSVFDAGVCWFIKASAALTGNAIHVPIEGYYWTQHAGMLSHEEGPKYNRHIKQMGAALEKAFPHIGGRIPTW
jgi:hypothetical protein